MAQINDNVSLYGEAPADFGLRAYAALVRRVDEAQAELARHMDEEQAELMRRAKKTPWLEPFARDRAESPIAIYNWIIRKYGRIWVDGSHVAFILDTIAEILARPADAQALAAVYDAMAADREQEGGDCDDQV